MEDGCQKLGAVRALMEGLDCLEPRGSERSVRGELRILCTLLSPSPAPFALLLRRFTLKQALQESSGS